ncbi:sulfatase [Flavihumibacter sp. ZG627]|uniref:sulfatase n=1 Tax=Flavihumibacter sp. ZG627 TaxID=1463156 RepID=UPI00057CB91C|nr:sulfatase [Flavihumibacter sp. ZG627]KIC90280.1 sulfatase [Flavihumibacter sp. ZG627]
MKKIILFLLLCLYVLNGIAQKQRPNIIVFLVDDMGWQDCSVPFWTKVTDLNKRYHTPNMERLAVDGIKFTNAYATPVCSPSRVSLMTGMNAANHAVTNWTLRKDQSVDYPDSILQPPAWNVNGLSPVAGIDRTVNATALPIMLKDAGYYNIHCGKAHFAAMETPAADPINIGFDINIAGHAAGGPGSYLGEENYGNKKGEHTEPWGVPGLEAYHGSDTFLTEALTIEALKAISVPVKKRQPFFLYMAHYAVHVPYTADKRFIKKYLDAGLPQKEAEYAALIEGMDKSLGDIMNYLKEKKIDKNTIIIFMSDNGGFSMPPRSGQPFTHNLPLMGGKGSVYEGGIREPMLVKWPGKVKPGTVAHQYVIIEDFFPTILEMAGIKKYKTIQAIDGRSFVPVLKTSTYRDTARSLIWHFPNKWIPEEAPGVNYHSAIRQGSWKMIYNMKTGTKELYNLHSDIGEQNDLSGQYPLLVKKLSLLLSDKLRKWNAPLPSFKNNGKPVALPDVL